MADEIDTGRLIWIVTGVHLRAELGDRPLAYRIEQAVRDRLAALLGPPPAGQPSRLSPAVVSDAYFLNNEEIQDRPVISLGGPGVNALSALLADKLPTAVAIEETLVVQMDVEMNDPRCCVWGMTHLDTVRAVELFLAKGYCEQFVRGVVERAAADDDDDDDDD
ncbi:MAG TPA: hypothetical protein VK324_11095 [Tepidisphaeraceae bacterium]|nr:hypothetical protein [Tepidisphaeraceae bacterium]